MKVKLTPPQQKLLDKMSKEENGFTIHESEIQRIMKTNLFDNHRERNIADKLVQLGVLKYEELNQSDYADYDVDWSWHFVISINN